MGAEIPPSLQKISEKSVLIDTCYFVIRTLRNVTRGYRNPEVSTEPSADVRLLAEQAIAEIQAHEGKGITDLSRDCIDDYIVLLEKLVRESYRRAVGQDPERAESLLSEMRQSNPEGLSPTP